MRRANTPKHEACEHTKTRGLQAQHNTRRHQLNTRRKYANNNFKAAKVDRKYANNNFKAAKVGKSQILSRAEAQNNDINNISIQSVPSKNCYSRYSMSVWQISR